jgi:hypothetical protein
MLCGHSTLNTVVLGEGMSEYQIPPYFGHHSCDAARAGRIDGTVACVGAHASIIFVFGIGVAGTSRKY